MGDAMKEKCHGIIGIIVKITRKSQNYVYKILEHKILSTKQMSEYNALGRQINVVSQ